MSDSLFLPRELFSAKAPKRAAPEVAPAEMVLGELQRFNPPGPSLKGRYNRRLQPRDPNAPKVDLWLDLAS